MPPPYPPNPQDELARERNHLAADRTLLSFIRSSLVLISVGVSLDQVVSALAPDGPYLDAWAYALSLVFIGLGVITLGLAVFDHQGEIRRLRSPAYGYVPRWSLGAAVGLTIFIAGVVAFCWLGVNLLQ
ncbi:MAG TPA: DUF202 domain-containing protein [Nodosilinea sp.]|nr:DUF202 domain-containing protein [Nodosilinea sp.]